MTRRMSLALALHSHQPVGNFEWVIAHAHEVAYRPMLEALERHPGVRLALHYTGPLLEWLRAERPESVERLGTLVARGQVELLGGGYDEPVLPALPERDRVGQLVRMAEELEATFGVRPRGAWLAERVWEPDVPTSLVDAGYRWTILDDAHFRAAAVPEEALWGPYATDAEGRLLTVFGTEQGLRYRIPFRDVDEVLGYLREHATEAGDRLGTMGDDGEKFGSWPTTWEHCWGRGRWVERFLEALEANAGWLTTTTPSAWLAEHPPIGRVAIPSGSYAEMGEWALPADEALAYARALHDARAEGRPEARWLRGAPWRNFQVKYREVNDLHKRMLRVSDAVAAMPPGPIRDRALDHLYQGQSNDCYWHGLFGGIYISHMRLATWEHLLAAEDVADAVTGSLRSGSLVDMDLDGRAEVLLCTPGQVVVVKPDEGAGIGSWDIRAARHALAAVLRRRPEAYHALLREQADLGEADTATGAHVAADAGSDDGGAASIHDRVGVREPGLADRLHYDWHERRSGLVHVLAPGTTPLAWAEATAADLADLATGAFEVLEVSAAGLRCRRDSEAVVADGSVPVRAEVTLRIGGGRLDAALDLEVAVVNRGDRPLAARLGVEWATTLLGGGGNPAAWWEVAGARSSHDATREATAVATLHSGNDDLGLELTTTAEPAADAWIAPIETVSNSESGFERSYQGGALLLSWPVMLAPGERWVGRVGQRVVVARDRAREEGLPLPGDDQPGITSGG